MWLKFFKFDELHLGIWEEFFKSIVKNSSNLFDLLTRSGS